MELKEFPIRVPPKHRPKSTFPVILNGIEGVHNGLFKELIRLPPVRATFLVSGLLLASTLIFTFIYYQYGSFTAHGLPLTEDRLFSEIFFFSFAMTTTYNDSFITPNDNITFFIANIQALFVQMLLVFITGIVYVRMTTPVPVLKATDYIVVNPTRKVLETRFIFKDKASEIVDARVTLTFRRHTEIDGVSMYKFDDLELRRDTFTNMRVMCMISHPITPSSPLFGLSLSQLKEMRAGFDLTIMGSDRSTMETVFEQFCYETKYNDILYGDFMFHDMLFTHNKQRYIDHSRLNKFVGYHNVSEPVAPGRRFKFLNRRMTMWLLLFCQILFLTWLVAYDTYVSFREEL